MASHSARLPAATLRTWPASPSENPASAAGAGRQSRGRQSRRHRRRDGRQEWPCARPLAPSRSCRTICQAARSCRSCARRRPRNWPPVAGSSTRSGRRSVRTTRPSACGPRFTPSCQRYRSAHAPGRPRAVRHAPHAADSICAFKTVARRATTLVPRHMKAFVRGCERRRDGLRRAVMSAASSTASHETEPLAGVTVAVAV
jgi:hypothetical protein